jgi:hypothetical protein
MDRVESTPDANPHHQGRRMAHRVIILWLVFYCLFCFTTLILTVLYDSWAIWNNEETVTDVGREISQRCPMLPWLWGISTGALAGHILWR